MNAHKVNTLKALGDSVIVADMAFEERQLGSGIILRNDSGKSVGIRPRWGRVYAVGPQQTAVKSGEWVLVAHGRWTRGIDIEDASGQHTVRRVDPNDILAVSSEPIFDETIGQKEV